MALCLLDNFSCCWCCIHVFHCDLLQSQLWVIANWECSLRRAPSDGLELLHIVDCFCVCYRKGEASAQIPCISCNGPIQSTHLLCLPDQWACGALSGQHHSHTQVSHCPQFGECNVTHFRKKKNIKLSFCRFYRVHFIVHWETEKVCNGCIIFFN